MGGEWPLARPCTRGLARGRDSPTPPSGVRGWSDSDGPPHRAVLGEGACSVVAPARALLCRVLVPCRCVSSQPGREQLRCWRRSSQPGREQLRCWCPLSQRGREQLRCWCRGALSAGDSVLCDCRRLTSCGWRAIWCGRWKSWCGWRAIWCGWWKSWCECCVFLAIRCKNQSEKRAKTGTKRKIHCQVDSSERGEVIGVVGGVWKSVRYGLWLSSDCFYGIKGRIQTHVPGPVRFLAVVVAGHRPAAPGCREHRGARGGRAGWRWHPACRGRGSPGERRGRSLRRERGEGGHAESRTPSPLS